MVIQFKAGKFFTILNIQVSGGSYVYHLPCNESTARCRFLHRELHYNPQKILFESRYILLPC